MAPSFLAAAAAAIQPSTGQQQNVAPSNGQQQSQSSESSDSYSLAPTMPMSTATDSLIPPAIAPPVLVVATSHGHLQGKTVELTASNGVKADIFLGVPYAQPPVGPLRFEKPQPLAPWPGVREATRVPPMCVPWSRPTNWVTERAQYSEDCLYLNVFRPHIEPNSATSMPLPLLPVLAIVHGGGFQQGSARRYGDVEEIGRKYLSRGIIVAVIQFRVGIFGYASSGHPDFGGNLGYWDQTAALRWLQRNLLAFGGDPRRVTLFGYSSGSSSVGTLAVSPHSRDLFAQAIQMSGSVLVCRAASNLVVEETHKLARAIDDGDGDCPVGKEDLKEWLKAKSVDQLLDGVEKIGSTRVGLNYVKFGPRLDGDFLPMDLPELIAQSKPKPTIMGLAEMEPLQSVLFGKNTALHWDAVPWELFPSFGPIHFEDYVRRVVVRPEEFGGQEAADGLVQDVLHFYLGGEQWEEQQQQEPEFYLEQLVQLMADLQFIVPFALELRARLAAGNTRLFAYVHTYANARLFPPQVAAGRLHRSFHDSDHSYVFRNPVQTAAGYQFDGEEQELEQYMAQCIGNFVKNGDPSTDSTIWEPIQQQSLDQSAAGFITRHMVIDGPWPRQRDQFDKRANVHFWEQMRAKYPQWDLVRGKPIAATEKAHSLSTTEQQQKTCGTTTVSSSLELVVVERKQSRAMSWLHGCVNENAGIAGRLLLRPLGVCLCTLVQLGLLYCKYGL